LDFKILAAGRRRSVLLEAFEALIEKMGHRIASFDDDAATQAADSMASRQRKGRPVERRDTMMAGIVRARHATLATRNLVHFEDLSVPVVNPWLL
jgi:predicted nucleic acid-binding protein